jgi:FAD/FMN-containing dehydrogenase
MTWIAPVSEAELRESLADAGAGSGPGAETVRVPTGGGDPPRDAPVGDIDVISLEAPSFAHIVEYEPKDLTITVGAGMRLAALQKTLGSEGQWLPPGAWGRARSVGGLVGAGTPGPFDTAFGSVRRHVLAVRTIAWDGRPLTWGRAVVKNVAGYDLKGLWCGSRGRLGVVTQASLRVWPQPEGREWLEVRGSSDGWTLLESLAAMEPEEDFRPDAVLWSGARSARGAYALIGLLGSEASVRSRGTRAREWVASHGYEVSERAGAATLTGPLASLESGTRSLTEVTFSIHGTRANLADVGRRLARALADTPGALDALPELGIVRVSYVRPDDVARAAAIRAALFQAAGSARIALETGGPEELAAGEARREASVRGLEEAVLEALGGAPRHWLADHV